jgi:hypothetical protein
VGDERDEAPPAWASEIRWGHWENFHAERMGSITLWLFNIAMENGPFIDDFPIETSIYEGFSMAMLNKQMVNQIQ